MNDTELSYLWMFAIGEISCLFAAIVITLIPVITRKDLFFGVRIPESEARDPEVIHLRRKYSLWMSLCSIITLLTGVILFLSKPQWVFLLVMYQPFVLFLAQFLVYLTCWRRALQIKQEKQWKVGFVGISNTNLPSGKGRLKDMPYFWYVICTVLCVLGILFGLYMYPKLPDVLVKHWDINMKPDAWDNKSIGTVIALPLVSFGMVILMFVSNASLYYTKLQVSLTNPVLSFAQHRMYRRLMTHALGLDTLLITVLFLAMLPMSFNIYVPDSTLMMACIFLFTILMLIPPIYVSIKAGQAGSKLKPVLSETEKKAAEQYHEKTSLLNLIDRGDDKLWMLGLFYYNPNDPSILIEDRFGSNGGLNYARPAAKALAVFFLILIVATYVYSTWIFLTVP